MANIQQLNDDYALMNSDANLIPAAFATIAADTKIQFCLAQRTPDCLTTDGIERINLGQADWTKDQIENNLKPNTIWDRDLYLNIWTLVFNSSESGLLGYAQFPGGPTSTDGVVVTYTSVGSLDIANPDGGQYGYGRTLTHEVGHWLNLIHIWGDDEGSSDECAGTDYVSDTPNQQVSNAGCPTFPHITCSNGPNGDLFMDYMDYTDDQCMHMFSVGQKDRMRAVVDGGDRGSLATSNCCDSPGNEICYCKAGANNTNDEKISNLSFAGINNTSTSTSGYEDFTSISGNATNNQTYLLTVTVSNEDPADQVIAWIDYNQDGDFDDTGEDVMSSNIGGPYTANITIPAGATSGTTRLRVRLHYTDQSPNSNSCGNSGWGQVEDYTINIGVSLPINLLKFEVEQFNDNDVKLMWVVDQLEGINSYVVEKSDGSPDNFQKLKTIDNDLKTSMDLILNDLERNTYFFRLKIINDDGQISYSQLKSVDITGKSQSIIAYPNPTTTDNINLYSPIYQNAKIYSIYGKALNNIKLKSGLNNLDLSNYPKGIYFLVNEYNQRVKIIIQ
ncbi:MAG: GEVED domain-containing protein [Saprospiraceae bacterium]